MGHPTGLVETLRTAAPHIADMGRQSSPAPAEWSPLPWSLPDGWQAEWKTPDYSGLYQAAAAERIRSSVRLIAFAYRPPSFFMYVTVTRDDLFATDSRRLPTAIRNGMLAVGRTGPMRVAVDDRSTSAEVYFQLLMHAWWRRGAEAEDVLRALASAYPAAARIAREGSDDELAMARLFDPIRRGLSTDQGARAVRGYVRRLARALREESRSELSGVVEARASRLGLSRSGYYKLLQRRGLRKDDRGYYAVTDDLEARLLRDRDEAELRAEAIKFLVRGGLKYDAARKRVQRKGPRVAVAESLERTHKRTHNGVGTGGIQGTPADSD